MNPQAQEHSKNKRTLKGKKAKLSERNNFKIVCSSVTIGGGGLYRPQKVKGRPSDMTPIRPQSLENITLTSCLCQGKDLTKQKEASRLDKRHFGDSGNSRI